MILGNPVKRVRLLAVLLLASLAWGTTAEFTHHHGVRPNGAVNQSLRKAAQTSDAANESSSIRFESGTTDGSSKSSKSGTECLICQLHRNLSATVFSNPPGLGTADVCVLYTTTSVVFQSSEFRVSGQGRAPPSNL